MTDSLEGVIGWRVCARDGCDRVQHEQEFFLADFADAKERAQRHADRLRRTTFPEVEGYSVAVPVLWGVLPSDPAARARCHAAFWDAANKLSTMEASNPCV